MPDRTERERLVEALHYRRWPCGVERFVAQGRTCQDEERLRVTAWCAGCLLRALAGLRERAAREIGPIVAHGAHWGRDDLVTGRDPLPGEHTEWPCASCIETVHEILAAADLLSEEGEPGVWWSFCPECGPSVTTDEDGCCVTCGATATGSWLEMERARTEELSEEGEPDPEWERCDSCGQRYPDVYWADDEQWAQVVGDEFAGLRCPECFKSEAWAMGLEPVLRFLAPPLTYPGPVQEASGEC